MFFTENSAGISYRELSYIINYREHLEFIKCAKGTNALDFQLVSYVGYLFNNTVKPIIVEVPEGSTTHTNISAEGVVPENVTITTFVKE